MVSSISSSSSDYLQELMAAMMNKISAADTDGTAGLSKTELSSIDTGDDKGENGFLKALYNNFDKLDADKNGQLTKEEIGVSKLSGPAQMGPPPGMSIENMFASADTDGNKGLSEQELSSIDAGSNKKAANFIENLTANFDSLDTNQDGVLSKEEIEAGKSQEPTQKEAKGEKSQTMATNSENNADSSFSNAKEQLGKLSEYLVKQLVNAYKENEAGIASALTSGIKSGLSALDIAV